MLFYELLALLIITLRGQVLLFFFFPTHQSRGTYDVYPPRTGVLKFIHGLLLCTLLLSSFSPILVQAAPLSAEATQETPPQPVVPEIIPPEQAAPKSITSDQLEQATPADTPTLTPQELPVIVSLESDKPSSHRAPRLRLRSLCAPRQTCLPTKQR